MTSIKPRPFLVVLATAVASQDGVVAPGDPVRNCRTRPGAEQRLLPVIGHPISGKCEPRFALSTNSLPAPVEPGTRAAIGREGLARRKRPVPARNREISLVTSASGRPRGPPVRSPPQARSSPASFLCLPTIPSCRRGSYPQSSLRAKRKTGVPGVRAASPRRGKEGKKDSAKCPEEEPAGEGRKGRSFSRVGLNPGGFLKSYCDLSGDHGHIVTSLFLVGTGRAELSPYLFGAFLSH